MRQLTQNATYPHFLGPGSGSSGELKNLETSIQLIMSRCIKIKMFLPDTYSCHLVSWLNPASPSHFSLDTAGTAFVRSRTTPSVTEVILHALQPPCSDSSRYGRVCSAVLCPAKFTKGRTHWLYRSTCKYLRRNSAPFWYNNHHSRLCSCHYSQPFMQILILLGAITQHWRKSSSSLPLRGEELCSFTFKLLPKWKTERHAGETQFEWF